MPPTTGKPSKDDAPPSDTVLECSAEPNPLPEPILETPSSQHVKRQPFGVEVFAGTGRLTAALRSLGMNDTVGVDRIAHKHLIAPLVRLDLVTDSGFSLLMELISNPNCMYVHFAPACGTASRKGFLAQRSPAWDERVWRE